jgi:hypothetical protein
MTGPRAGDVIIRDAVAAPGEFLIADALTNETLLGPIPSIRAAVDAARAFSPNGTIWRQTSDERGRSLGDPFAMPLDGTKEIGQKSSALSWRWPRELTHLRRRQRQ